MHMLAMNAQIWDHDVDAVMNAHRPAVHARAGSACENRLPIHMAAANIKSKESFIQRLIQLNPRAATLPDRQGKLPFHLACEIGKGWDDGVRCIHEAFPAAISTPEDNKRGWLPLHLAAASPVDEQDPELIRRLVELYPNGASTPDHKGRYPLHLACGTGKSWKGGLEILMEAYPEAIAPADANGLLPFHHATMYYSEDRASDRGNVEHDDIGSGTTRSREAVGETVTEGVEVVESEVHSHDEESKESPDEYTSMLEAEAVDTLFQLLRADPTALASAGFLNESDKKIET